MYEFKELRNPVSEISDELYRLWHLARDMEDKAGMYFLEMAILHFGEREERISGASTGDAWRALKRTIEGTSP